MAWTRDPVTNEWVLVDEDEVFEPAPRLSVAAPRADEAAGAGYGSSDLEYPVMYPDEAPARSAEGGYSHPTMAAPEPAPLTTISTNEDGAARQRWLETEVWPKGHVADFDSGWVISRRTGERLYRIPSFPAMN